MSDTPSKEKQDKDEKKTSPKGKSIEPVYLKDEICIYPDKRLPKYDQGEIKAYEASGSGGVKSYALVCEKHIIPQIEYVHKYTGLSTPHLPKLTAGGVVEWKHEDCQRFAFFYDDKMGEPIKAGCNPRAMGIRPDLVISTIFRNLLGILSAMREKGIVHGGICVENLFDGGSPTFENTCLADMLAAPSGYTQSALYETIPRGLASPLGKGQAEISDDIYALGVTLATLIRTVDPAEGLNDAQIISQKIEMGSFNFIIGRSRFPSTILEFLRGTLNDDIELRWTFEDILTWTEGRRVSAKQSTGAVSLKASRPIEFAQEKIFKPQELSMLMPKNVAMVMPLVENGELSLWLNRSLQNKVIEERFESAALEAKKDVGASNYADRLVGFVSIAICPENPIFYKQLQFHPSGFTNLFIEAVQRRADLSPYVQIIQLGLFSFWNKFQDNVSQNNSDMVGKISSCYRLLSQSIIGSGIERCVYILSPMAPCLSEKLSRYYVRSTEDFLRALDDLATRKDRPDWYLDRHIVAFLSVRDKSIIEPFLADIASNEKYRHRHGALKVFAAIQRRDKIGALPGLSNWVASLMDPIINRFHDRERRRQIKAHLEKIKDQGSLEKIAELFDVFEEMQLDNRQYAEAMKNYQLFKKEKVALEYELNNNKNFGIENGRQTSMMVSGAVAAIVVVIYLLFALIGGRGGSVF